MTSLFYIKEEVEKKRIQFTFILEEPFVSELRKEMLSCRCAHRGVIALCVRAWKLVFNFEPAFFIVYEKLEVVLPLWLAVIPDLKYGLKGVGVSLVDAQHLPSVPHL